MPQNPLTMTVDVALGRGLRALQLAQAVLADPLATKTSHELAQLVIDSSKEAVAVPEPKRFKASLPDEVTKVAKRSLGEPANTDEWDAEVAKREASKQGKR